MPLPLMLRLLVFQAAYTVEGFTPFCKLHVSSFASRNGHTIRRKASSTPRSGGRRFPTSSTTAYRRLIVASSLSKNDEWRGQWIRTDALDLTIQTKVEPMENLYQEWTLDQDQLLWENRQQSVVQLASMLGRGLRGVEKRLAKLKDVESSAYQRLFVSLSTDESSSEEESSEKTKLTPASQVLRRIQYDYSIPSDKFSLLFYDRVDDTILEAPLMAPNTSIKGTQALLVDALPEHRIVAVKYMERVVWDREKRLDLVFSDPGLASVIESYEEWKRDRDAAVEWNRQRQREVTMRLQHILGSEGFKSFQQLAARLQEAANDPTISTKLEAERFVESSLDLFHAVQDNPSLSLDPTIIPRNDYEALDAISELVALLSDNELRQIALSELSLTMARCEGKVSNLTKVGNVRVLPEIREEDITETFIKGRGPGGQKINKTSNRVLLVHEPTQLRVECQDTRSLQQNRKIARKRLQLKLDEYLNGSQSIERVKAQIASTKKSKAKARSRARQRRKQAAKEAEED